MIKPVQPVQHHGQRRPASQAGNDVLAAGACGTHNSIIGWLRSSLSTKACAAQLLITMNLGAGS